MTPTREDEISAVRWIDMTSAEIADMAHRQIEGDFGPVSDAITALHLIEALAHRLRDPI
jgi:hypothetical protein